MKNLKNTSKANNTVIIQINLKSKKEDKEKLLASSEGITVVSLKEGAVIIIDLSYLEESVVEESKK